MLHMLHMRLGLLRSGHLARPRGSHANTHRKLKINHFILNIPGTYATYARRATYAASAGYAVCAIYAASAAETIYALYYIAYIICYNTL